jgi:hypothetical protein
VAAVPSLTLPQLNGVIRTVHDATVANFEYTSGKKVIHQGGATDPKLMGLVMQKLVDRYCN